MSTQNSNVSSVVTDPKTIRNGEILKNKEKENTNDLKKFASKKFLINDGLCRITK